MFKRLLLAAALTCLPFTTHAQECEFPFDATFGAIQSEGMPTEEIPVGLLPRYVDLASALLGTPIEGVTRGFVVIDGGRIFLGLEVNECLLPRIHIGNVAPAPASEQLSGRGKNGEIGA